MSLSFALEPLEKCWSEVMFLAKQHWHETEEYRHGEKFNPNYLLYRQYESAGLFFLATARANGAMVGYAGMYVTPSMHTQRMIATEDTWFLLPEYRKGWNAVRFYKFVENECLRRRAIGCGMTVKNTNGASKVLEFLGYKEVSRQYYKHLIDMPVKQSNNPSKGRADSALARNSKESSDVRTKSTARS